MQRTLTSLAIALVASTAAVADGVPSKEAARAHLASAPFRLTQTEPSPNDMLWGDTHLHTGLSLDAGAFGNTLGPEEAWRFAKGEQVISSTGQPVRLSRPLDWMVLTDHTDLMGFAPDLQAGKPGILADPKGLEWYQGYSAGGEAAGKAAFDIITNFSQMTLPELLLESYSPGADAFAFTWEDIVKAAERHNAPGQFTAFIGFEWTSVPKGFNLHRNVMLRDGPCRSCPPSHSRPLATLIPNRSTAGWRLIRTKPAGGRWHLPTMATCRMAGCSRPKTPITAARLMPNM